LRALSLFSGGLDSQLAVKIIQEQGIEVIGLHFTTPFFGGSREILNSGK
jgi:tRNA-specific 2-thiouridylase